MLYIRLIHAKIQKLFCTSHKWKHTDYYWKIKIRKKLKGIERAVLVDRKYNLELGRQVGVCIVGDETPAIRKISRSLRKKMKKQPWCSFQGFIKLIWQMSLVD
mgnify:CR=1 FL=1